MDWLKLLDSFGWNHSKVVQQSREVTKWELMKVHLAFEIIIGVNKFHKALGWIDAI